LGVVVSVHAGQGADTVEARVDVVLVKIEMMPAKSNNANTEAISVAYPFRLLD
jgi:hypothetical protein